MFEVSSRGWGWGCRAIPAQAPAFRDFPCLFRENWYRTVNIVLITIILG